MKKDHKAGLERYRRWKDNWTEVADPSKKDKEEDDYKIMTRLCAIAGDGDDTLDVDKFNLLSELDRNSPGFIFEAKAVLDSGTFDKGGSSAYDCLNKNIISVLDKSNKYSNLWNMSSEAQEAISNDGGNLGKPYRMTYKDTLKVRAQFLSILRPSGSCQLSVKKVDPSTDIASKSDKTLLLPQKSNITSTNNPDNNSAPPPPVPVPVPVTSSNDRGGEIVCQCGGINCDYMRTMTNFQNLYVVCDDGTKTENYLCIETDICSNAVDDIYMISKGKSSSSSITTDSRLHSCLKKVMQARLMSGNKLRQHPPRLPYKLDRGKFNALTEELYSKSTEVIDNLNHKHYKSCFSDICTTNTRGKIAVLLCDITTTHNYKEGNSSNVILSDRASVFLYDCKKEICKEVDFESLFKGIRPWEYSKIVLSKDDTSYVYKAFYNNYLYYDAVMRGKELDIPDCRFLDMLTDPTRKKEDNAAAGGDAITDFCKESIRLCCKLNLRSSIPYFVHKLSENVGCDYYKKPYDNCITRLSQEEDEFLKYFSDTATGQPKKAVETSRFQVCGEDILVSKLHSYVAQMKSGEQFLKVLKNGIVIEKIDLKKKSKYNCKDIFCWSSIEGKSLDVLLILEEKQLKMFGLTKEVKPSLGGKKLEPHITPFNSPGILSRIVVIPWEIPHAIILEVTSPSSNAFLNFHICSLQRPIPSKVHWRFPNEKDVLLRTSISDICVHVPSRGIGSRDAGVVAYLVLSCKYGEGEGVFEGVRGYQIVYNPKEYRFEIDMLFHHLKPHLEFLCGKEDVKETASHCATAEAYSLFTKQSCIRQIEKGSKVGDELFLRRCVALVPFRQEDCYLILFTSPYYEEIFFVPVNFSKLKEYKANLNNICPAFKGYLRPLPTGKTPFVGNALNEKFGYNSSLDSSDFASIKLSRLFASQYISSINVVTTKLDCDFDHINPYQEREDRIEGGQFYLNVKETPNDTEQNFSLNVALKNSPILVVQTKALPSKDFNDSLRKQLTTLCNDALSLCRDDLFASAVLTLPAVASESGDKKEVKIVDRKEDPSITKLKEKVELMKGLTRRRSGKASSLIRDKFNYLFFADAVVDKKEVVTNVAAGGGAAAQELVEGGVEKAAEGGNSSAANDSASKKDVDAPTDELKIKSDKLKAELMETDELLSGINKRLLGLASGSEKEELGKLKEKYEERRRELAKKMSDNLKAELGDINVLILKLWKDAPCDSIEDSSVGKLMFFGFSCMDIGLDVIHKDYVKVFIDAHRDRLKKETPSDNRNEIEFTNPDKSKFGMVLSREVEDVMQLRSKALELFKCLEEGSNESFGTDLIGEGAYNTSDLFVKYPTNRKLQEFKDFMERKIGTNWSDNTDNNMEGLIYSELCHHLKNDYLTTNEYKKREDINKSVEENNYTTVSKTIFFGSEKGFKSDPEHLICDLSSFYQLRDDIKTGVIQKINDEDGNSCDIEYYANGNSSGLTEPRVPKAFIIKVVQDGVESVNDDDDVKVGDEVKFNFRDRGCWMKDGFKPPL